VETGWDKNEMNFEGGWDWVVEIVWIDYTSLRNAKNVNQKVQLNNQSINHTIVCDFASVFED